MSFLCQMGGHSVAGANAHALVCERCLPLWLAQVEKLPADEQISLGSLEAAVELLEGRRYWVAALVLRRRYGLVKADGQGSERDG